MIFDILIRFRVHKIALAGDIEKAFLNAEVDLEQSNLLTLLPTGGGGGGAFWPAPSDCQP